MNKQPIMILGLVVNSLALLGCGSNGNETSSLGANSYHLTGTVPGTLIEAYCDDGSTYHVNSTQNGTTKHPFSLALPKGLPCRIVMITNENDIEQKVVTPIKFTDGQGTQSIAIKSNDDVSVGNVGLALRRADMQSDHNNDGVEDAPILVTLEGGTVVEKPQDPLDSDHDGIINVYEDDDGDGVSNHDDNDDDNDGILDIDDADHGNDLDHDGVSNGQDVDDDNDGIPDVTDTDDDNDGIPDVTDTDDDNDGIDDAHDSDHNGGDDNHGEDR